MNTMQQEFDAVVNHLYKQGKPARNEQGNCAYRGANGTSCAVGCRIPDGMYLPEMDAGGVVGMSVGTVVVNFIVPPELREYQLMFEGLQNIHDISPVDATTGNYDLSHLSQELQGLAYELQLTFAVPA